MRFLILLLSACEATVVPAQSSPDLAQLPNALPDLATTPSSSPDLATASSSPDLATVAPTIGDQWVMAYYVGYHASSFTVDQIDWSGITHLIIAPLLVSASSGSYTGLDLTFFHFSNNSEGAAWAQAISAAAHKNGRKAMMMLGGAGAGTNIKIAANATNRAKFVSDLVAAMRANQYDGIDLDWEDQIDYPSFIALAHDLRAAAPDLILTAPGGSVTIGQSVPANIVQLATHLDRYNLMTYGAWLMAGVGQGWCSWHASPLTGAYNQANGAGCSAPRDIASSLDAYVKAGIPAGKMGMGAAFSAMCYTGAPYVSQPGQVTEGDNFGGGDNDYPLSDFFAAGSTFDKAGSAERQRDANAQVPYLSLANVTSDSHCKGSTRYISYDDETSLIAKGAFSKANHYGGIIIWTLDQGYLPANASGGRAPNALTQALKMGFLD